MLLAERFARDLEGFTDLPSIPPAVARLLATVETPDVSLSDVIDIIHTDPALAAQILRVANSAAFAGRMPASTIRDALLRLGLREVRRLAVVLSLYNAAGHRDQVIDHDTFWRHSLGAAHAAEVIARRASVPGGTAAGAAESLFLGGLFHDLGLLALATYYPEEYGAARRLAEASDAPFCAAEVELFLTDHGELGAQLATHWRLPALAIAAIRAHHRLELAPPELRWPVQVLQVAEAVAQAAGIGDLAEGYLLGLEAGVPDLGLSAEDVAAIIEETRRETEQATRILAVAR